MTFSLLFSVPAHIYKVNSDMRAENISYMDAFVHNLPGAWFLEVLFLGYLFVHLFSVFLLLLFETGSLHSPGCLGTLSADQAGI